MLVYLPWLENSQEGPYGLGSTFCVNPFLRVSRQGAFILLCLAHSTEGVLGVVKGNPAVTFPWVSK